MGSMQRILVLLIALAVVGVAVAVRFVRPAGPPVLHVAAAVSLKDVLTRIAADYETRSGRKVEFTFGSSGQLASQIRAGAAVDVFISAASRQVDELSAEGLILPGDRSVVAGNALVVIVPLQATSVPTSLAELTAASVKRLAMGEPRSVPAGEYAEQALRHAGVLGAMRDRLVYGTNARQVLDYVERGEVSAGVVYATDARMAAGKVKIAFAIPPASHEPIVYPAAIVATSKQKPAARAFLEQLQSAEARSQLQSFGFAPSPHVATTGPVP
jgi:molybdate transport system substrate-binding protein